MINHSIAETGLTFKSIEDIDRKRCPKCGFDFTTALFHIGGYAVGVPHVVCSNPDGGQAHVKVRIPDLLYYDWWDYVKLMDLDTGVFEEEQMEEVENA